MTQQVQELIDKIKTEGIQSAMQEAGQITTEAEKKASKILMEAKVKTDQMIQSAKDEIRKMQTSSDQALKQASRDLLIALRGEIGNMLNRIIASEVKETLSSEQLAAIITDIIKASSGEGKDASDIRVTVSKDDLNKLKGGFVEKLKKQIKGKISLEASDDIDCGFTISFDAGKSCFDFSDQSLVQFLGQYLNSEVSAILKNSNTK